MSVLVAVRDGEVTAIGCDGRVSRGETITTDAAVKWLRIRPDLFLGLAGQWRATDLVSEALAVGPSDWLRGQYPIDDPGEPDGRARLVANKVRELCRVDGFVDESKDGCARFLDLSMLIAQPLALHSVDTAGCVSRVESHHAIGSGAPFALGVLDAFAYARRYKPAGCELDPVRAAVEIAIRRNVYCGGNIFVYEVR